MINNNDIVVLKGDKDSSITVTDKKDYVNCRPPLSQGRLYSPARMRNSR